MLARAEQRLPRASSPSPWYSSGSADARPASHGPTDQNLPSKKTATDSVPLYAGRAW